MDNPAGLDLVHSFLVVADELNFRRGAERLHLDQSALTRRIQKVEQTIGFRLFECTTREVSLTAAGRRFYEDNMEVLRRYGESVVKARGVGGHAGTVRFAYMAFAATDLVPCAVAHFGQLHPHVDVKLRYIRTQGQKLALASDEIDIGYMIGPFVHSEYSHRAGLRPTLCRCSPQPPADASSERAPARPIQHPEFRSETVLVWKRTNRSGPTRGFIEVATKLPPTL